MFPPSLPLLCDPALRVLVSGRPSSFPPKRCIGNFFTRHRRSACPGPPRVLTLQVALCPFFSAFLFSALKQSNSGRRSSPSLFLHEGLPRAAPELLGLSSLLFFSPFSSDLPPPYELFIARFVRTHCCHRQIPSSPSQALRANVDFSSPGTRLADLTSPSSSEQSRCCVLRFPAVLRGDRKIPLFYP